MKLECSGDRKWHIEKRENIQMIHSRIPEEGGDIELSEMILKN
jgi:hypothetical protein